MRRPDDGGSPLAAPGQQYRRKYDEAADASMRSDHHDGTNRHASALHDDISVAAAVVNKGLRGVSDRAADVYVVSGGIVWLVLRCASSRRDPFSAWV